MSDTANGYIRVAVMAIRFAQTPEELREWWRDEEENRKNNGVYGAYERRLIEACRHHVSILAEKAKLPQVAPAAPPRPKRGK